MRSAVLQTDAIRPREPAGPSRQERPRKTWAGVMHAHALAAAGTQESLESMARNRTVWRTQVRKYCTSVVERNAKAPGNIHDEDAVR